MAFSCCFFFFFLMWSFIRKGVADNTRDLFGPEQRHGRASAAVQAREARDMPESTTLFFASHILSKSFFIFYFLFWILGF